MSEHEWKPCPFCGSPAEPGEFWHENASHGQNRVWCSRNECELGRYRSEGIYPDEWQARPIEDAQAAQIAELRQRTRELHSVLSAAVLARDSARARATDLKDRLRAIQAERDALMARLVDLLESVEVTRVEAKHEAERIAAKRSADRERKGWEPFVAENLNMQRQRWGLDNLDRAIREATQVLDPIERADQAGGEGTA